jgi:hypothetical protein
MDPDNLLGLAAVLDFLLGLAALLAVLLLIIVHQVAKLRAVSDELTTHLKSLKSHASDVDRLATALQARESDRLATELNARESERLAKELEARDSERLATELEARDSERQALGKSKQAGSGSGDTRGEGASAPSTAPHGPPTGGDLVIVHDEEPATFEAVRTGRIPGANYEQLYAAWCNGSRQPSQIDLAEVSPLRYAGEERTSDFSPPTYLFEDHPQAGEFVRFSSPDDDASGFAFPHPMAYFNDRVHRILFPELTAANYNPQQLAGIRPVQIRRRPDGKWQKA